MAQRNDGTPDESPLSVAERFRLMTLHAKAAKEVSTTPPPPREESAVRPSISMSSSPSSPSLSSMSSQSLPIGPPALKTHSSTTSSSFFSIHSRSPSSPKPEHPSPPKTFDSLLSGLMELTRRQDSKDPETRPRRHVQSAQLVAVVHLPGRYFDHGHEQAAEARFSSDTVVREVVMLAMKQFRHVPGLKTTVPASLGLFTREGQLLPNHALAATFINSGDTTEFMLNDTGEGPKGEGPKTSVANISSRNAAGSHISMELSSSDDDDEAHSNGARPSKILEVGEEPRFGVIKSGELLKKTSTSVLGFQPWKRYFFTLDATGFHYYKDKVSSRPRFYDTGKGLREEPPKPLQSVHNFQILSSSVHPEDGRRFLLETTLGTFSLQADQLKDSEEWIKLLAARGEASYLERTGNLYTKGPKDDEGLAQAAKSGEPTGFVKVLKPIPKGQGTASWERRYLVLSEKRLEMFLSVKDSQAGKMVDCVMVANICGFNLPSSLTRTGRCRFDLVVSADKAVRCSSLECEDVEDCRRWVHFFADAAAKLRGKVDIYIEPPKKDRKLIEVLDASDPLRTQVVTKKTVNTQMSKAKNCHALRQMLSTGDLSREDQETIELVPQYQFACSLHIPSNLDKSECYYYVTISVRQVIPGAEWKQQGHTEVVRGSVPMGLDDHFSAIPFRVVLSAIDHSRARPLRRVQQALGGRERKEEANTSSLGGKLEALANSSNQRGNNNNDDDAFVKRFFSPALPSSSLKARERFPKFREEPNMEIRISLYRCRNSSPGLYGEGEPDIQVLMGYHTVSVRDLEPTMQTPLNPSAEGYLRMNFLGMRHIQASNTERFQHRSFILQDRKGNDLICHETLQESPFTFSVPASVLEWTGKTKATTVLGLAADSDFFSSSSFPTVTEWPSLSPISQTCLDGMDNTSASTSVTMNRMARFASNRKQAIKKTLVAQERLLNVYEARTCGGLQYKPSTCKTDARLRAIATNLHLHTFTVVTPSARTTKDNSNGKSNKRNGDLSVGDNEDKQGTSQRVSYHTTTVGAFAAHHMGFSENSMQRLQEAVHAAEVAAEAAKLTPLWLDRKLELEAEIDNLRQRQEVILCQALSALVNSFTANLANLLEIRSKRRARTGVDDPSLFPLLHLKHMGFLFQLTCLLSTFGDELSMMADTSWAMEQLSFLKLRIMPSSPRSSSHTPKESTTASAGSSETMSFVSVAEEDVIDSDTDDDFTEANDDSSDLYHLISLIKVEIVSGSDEKYKFAGVSSTIANPECLRGVVELSLPRRMLNLVPPELLDDQGKPVLIEVVPVLITQGVNEMQNLAQKLGKTDYQQEINTRSILKLRLFMQESTVYRMAAEKIKSASTLLEMANSLTECGSLLDLVEDRDKHKRVRFLELADRLVRQIEGSGTAIACKSAKDRTSCWATYRHGRFLVADHEVDEAAATELVNLFRLHGVRRFNVFKNTGQWQFAFNAFQRKSLPTKFRPPEECCGKAVT